MSEQCDDCMKKGTDHPSCLGCINGDRKLTSDWIPTLWYRKKDMDLHVLGLEISCSTSPFYEGVRYAVRSGTSYLVLNHNGDWEEEPFPSQRDTNFYNRCRFHSFDEAVNAAEKIIRKRELKESESESE